MIGNSEIRFFNHLASEQVVSRAIHSSSIVLLKITVSLQDFNDTAVPPNMNTNPVVDTLLESVTQLASLYPSIASRYPM